MLESRLASDNLPSISQPVSPVPRRRFWEKHDVFTIPHWTWAGHAAASADADLFLVTDRSLFEHPDLLREELQ